MDLHRSAEFLAVPVVRDRLAAGPLQIHHHRLALDVLLALDAEQERELGPESESESSLVSGCLLNYRLWVFVKCLNSHLNFHFLR